MIHKSVNELDGVRVLGSYEVGDSRHQAVLDNQSPLLASGRRPKDSSATGLDWV
jgi:hypothetical protein